MFSKLIKRFFPDVTFAEVKYDTFTESLAKAKVARTQAKARQPICQSMFVSSADLEIVDKYKEQFGYWDEWTGGRYARVENPRPTEATDYSLICRSNPVTGFWEPR